MKNADYEGNIVVKEDVQKSGILLLIIILKCIVLQLTREKQGRIRFPDSVLLLYSSRFIVFDKSGSIMCVSQKEHEQIMPHPGWVEHDPMTILKNVEVEHLDLDPF